MTNYSEILDSVIAIDTSRTSSRCLYSFLGLGVDRTESYLASILFFSKYIQKIEKTSTSICPQGVDLDQTNANEKKIHFKILWLTTNLSAFEKVSEVHLFINSRTSHRRSKCQTETHMPHAKLYPKRYVFRDTCMQRRYNQIVGNRNFVLEQTQSYKIIARVTAWTGLDILIAFCSHKENIILLFLTVIYCLLRPYRNYTELNFCSELPLAQRALGPFWVASPPL